LKNHTQCMTPDLHIIIHCVGREQHIHTCHFKHNCWYTFTIPHLTLVMCLWTDPNSRSSLGFQFKIDVEQLHPPSEPLTELSPDIYNTGPCLIKNTGQHQMLFNPLWSLKRVELFMQVDISAIKPTCSPFLTTSFTG